MEEATYTRKAAFQRGFIYLFIFFKGGNIYIAQNQTLPAEEGKEWELLVGFSREGSHANVTKEHSREAVL